MWLVCVYFSLSSSNRTIWVPLYQSCLHTSMYRIMLLDIASCRDSHFIVNTTLSTSHHGEVANTTRMTTIHSLVLGQIQCMSLFPWYEPDFRESLPMFHENNTKLWTSNSECFSTTWTDLHMQNAPFGQLCLEYSKQTRPLKLTRLCMIQYGPSLHKHAECASLWSSLVLCDTHTDRFVETRWFDVCLVHCCLDCSPQLQLGTRSFVPVTQHTVSDFGKSFSIVTSGLIARSVRRHRYYYGWFLLSFLRFPISTSRSQPTNR